MVPLGTERQLASGSFAGVETCSTETTLPGSQSGLSAAAHKPAKGNSKAQSRWIESPSV